eukprot:scaffold1202_cov257-Chaetoceros_neogracile.AAC.4
MHGRVAIRVLRKHKDEGRDEQGLAAIIQTQSSMGKATANQAGDDNLEPYYKIMKCYLDTSTLESVEERCEHETLQDEIIIFA